MHKMRPSLCHPTFRRHRAACCHPIQNLPSSNGKIGSWGGKDEGAHNELHGLGSTDCHEAADALITPDGKRPHGVPGLPKDGLLSSQLLKHLHEVARYISPWFPYAVERRAPLGNPGKPSPLGLQRG